MNILYISMNQALAKPTCRATVWRGTEEGGGGDRPTDRKTDRHRETHRESGRGVRG